MLKGTTLDVHPGKKAFHLTLIDGEQKEISLSSPKAIFFVKSFEGHLKGHREIPVDSALQQPGYGLKVVVEFKDGEKIVGTTMNRRSLENDQFFLFPLNPTDNNERILINRKATRNIGVRK